ncbi:MAG TPA: hypothetical protein VGB30_01170 [bacterium]|jgi:hypothetical protein
MNILTGKGNFKLILPVVAFLLLLFCPRANSKVYMDYDFSGDLVWQMGHFEVYDIIERGVVIGEARVEYSELTMLDDVAYRLEWEETWTEEDQEYNVIQDVKFAGSDLRALMCSRVERTGDKEWRYEGNYSGDNMTIQAYYPDQPDRYDYAISRSIRFSDSDMVPILLRNIPFEPENFVTFTVMDIKSHSLYTPIVKVTGTEVVETANTQYDCWVVNVSTSTSGYTAWYSRSDQHYLIKIRYNDRDFVLNHHS